MSLDLLGAAYDALVEDTVLVLQQSEAIQLARVDAYLDGITLAAEQVQDTRITLLETPPAVSGWEYIGNVALTFAMGTTVFGKVLTAVTQRIFTPVLRQSVVFMALPKSPYGKDLAKQAKRLAQMNRLRQLDRTSARDQARLASWQKQAEAMSAVLQRGAGGSGLQKLGKTEVELYHASLEAIIRGTDAAKTNLSAAARATREAIQREKPTPERAFAAGDSAGVTIAASARQYASVTRMGIRLRHARFIHLVRTKQLLPADLGIVANLFDWDDLKVDEEGDTIAANLTDIRHQYQLLFEALIWARLYGFSRQSRTPDLISNSGKFPGIGPDLVKYWTGRFAGSLDIWNSRQGKFSGAFSSLPFQTQARYVREYFWDLTDELTKVFPGIKQQQLTQAVGS